MEGITTIDAQTWDDCIRICYRQLGNIIRDLYNVIHIAIGATGTWLMMRDKGEK